MSETELYELFDRINQTHFNGEVPLCRLKWSDRIGIGRTHHRYADFTVFEDKQFLSVIRLSKKLLADSSKEEIAKVMFHEMIHVWLWNQQRPWGHTAEFKRKVNTFDGSLLGLC
jgi:predicted SprT family Zn-dependent metalloprotease